MRLTFSLPLVCLFSFTFVLLLASASLAQILSVGDDTSTPIPGVGHDYIRLLSETVNPANGSVSLRIQVPMPKARGITLPFSFAYDSNGVNHLIAVTGRASWISNGAFLSAGGWSYAVPLVSARQWTSTTRETLIKLSAFHNRSS